MATLKEQIASDIGTIFCRDDTEFCAQLRIGLDSKHTFTVFGSLQSNTVDNNSGNGSAPLQKVSHTLLVPYPIGGSDGIEVNVGEPIYIDGVAYRVCDFIEEMGIATIYLEKCADRRRFG